MNSVTPSWRLSSQQGIQQFFRKDDGLARTAKRLHRRTRAVRRQVQAAAEPRQLLLPIGELLVQNLAGQELAAATPHKSAYCTGSSGSGDGRSAEKAS